MVRLGLFLSSYSALFFILALRFDRAPLAIGSGALAALGIAAAFWILGAERAKGSAAYEIAKTEDQGAEVTGYIATYLLPFVTLAQPTDRDVVSYLLFLCISALVYTGSDMLQVNPILYLMRRRVVKVTTPKGWVAYLITSSAPMPGETIQATTLASRVLVQTKQRSSK
jgi:hypothetical protein